jgi:SpoVK/Ycf46/Vps4 family AAA+-type ATPase
MKSNGGVFVIDDFGRQQVRPRDLLNRWMIPLDRGTDYLGLPTGHKLEIPFDCLVFFATNLNPSDLVEEAFLRRIRYKIFMPNPKREQFAEILRRVCAKRDIEYREEAVDLIYREFYARFGIEPRSCHPGDIVADVVDHARYLGRPAELEEDLVMNACLSYFIDMPKLAAVEYDDITQGASRG